MARSPRTLGSVSLRLTVTALIVTAAVIPSLFISFPLITYIRNITQQEALHELQAIAQSVASVLERGIENAVNGARTTASDSDVRRSLGSLIFLGRVDHLLQELLSKNPLIDELRLIHDDGRTITVKPDSMAGSEAPPEIAAAASKMIALGQKTPQRIDTPTVIVFFLPVEGPVNDTAGVLVMSVSHARLMKVATEALPRPVAIDLQVNEQRGGQNLGPDLIASTASIPIQDSVAKGGSLAVRISEAAELRMAPVRNLTWAFSTLVAFSAGLFGFVGFLLARRFLSPVDRLTRHVERVAGGDYTSPIPDVPFVELQSFGQTLAKMGHSILAHLDTIRAQERSKADLQNAQIRSELNAMRQQMNPHFLFNSLNAIATLTRVDPAKAETMTTDLASLFRFTLESSADSTIPLARELDISRRYLELEKIRFGKRLSYTITAPDHCEVIFIPGMLLQTLAENAIKHGIAPSREGGSIDISIARESGGYAAIISNTGWPLKEPKAGQDMSISGTGLVNTVRRLTLLYGDSHKFNLAAAPDGTTVASFFFSGEKI